MTTTYYFNADALGGINEAVTALYEGIQEDFDKIDYAEFLGKELDLMADLHKGFFDSSAGPDGSAWKPNAPSTVRQKGHSTILRGVRGRRPRKYRGPRGGQKLSRARWIAGYRLSTSLTAKTRQTFGDAIREAIGTEGGGALKFGTAVEYSGFNDDRPHVGINDRHLDAMTNRTVDFALSQLAE